MPPPHVHDLTVGDIYQHMPTPTTSLLWLWIADDGQARWMPVNVGFQRSDGRRLALTQIMQDPVWVTPTYYAHRFGS